MAIDHAQASESIVCLLNKRRAAHGRGGLVAHEALVAAAQHHTEQMLATGCFDHECRGETGPISRIRLRGYMRGRGAWGAGENIAVGYGKGGSPAKIVRAWMRSSRHRENILRPRYQHVGVGFAHGTPYDPGAGAGTYTADFGYGG